MANGKNHGKSRHLVKIMANGKNHGKSRHLAKVAANSKNHGFRDFAIFYCP